MLMDIGMGIAPGVVTRLRFVFVTIALIVLTVTALSVDRLNSLNAAVRNHAISSVNVFVSVEDAKHCLKNLIVLMQQVNNATTPDKLTQLGGELRETLSSLRVKIADLRRIQQTEGLSDEMLRSLVQLETVAMQVFETNTAIVGHRANLDRIQTELRTTRDVIHRILEDETFEGDLSEGSGDIALAAQVDAGALGVAQRYSQELLRANAIASIGLEFDAVLDRMIGLRNAQDLAQLRMIDSSIRLKLRSITALLKQIETEEARAALARSLIEVREKLIGKSGAEREVESLLERRTEAESYVLTQLNETERMSSLANRLNVDARTAIERASADVGQKTKQMIWVLALAALTVLGVIGVTTFVVVEHQINVRMSKLTRAVVALAGGARNVDVDVWGVDELGKMAASLEVFKSNANELVRSNHELEKFAYVAAHDLRSPLRAIQDLTDWIVHDQDNLLSDNSQKLMLLLDNRVDRLNKLLSDLLEYSRAGTESDALGPVVMGDVVREIADMLDPQQVFKITYCGEVEAVTTFVTPFRQILQNLFNNGMKHHDRDRGEIRVSTYLLNERIICNVTDDGPGIDLKYQDKIFDLFQTLRPRDEVEGSGLGLAVIRKLVEHYDGKITVISDPAEGRGTTFQFDMPIKAAKTLPGRAAA